MKRDFFTSSKVEWGAAGSTVQIAQDEGDDDDDDDDDDAEATNLIRRVGVTRGPIKCKCK